MTKNFVSTRVLSFLLILITIHPSFLYADYDTHGGETPIFKSSWELGKKATSEGNIVLSCYEFKNYAITVKNFGEIGNEVSVRTTNAKSHTDLCSKDFSGPSKVIRSKLESTFLLLKGNLLFLNTVETFGLLSTFEVHNLSNSKILLTDNFDQSQRFSVNGNAKNPIIKYYQVANKTCDLYENLNVCWNKIKIENLISEKIKLNLAKCFKYANTLIPQKIDGARLQMSWPVKVTNINANAKITTLPGVVNCFLEP